MVEKQYNSCKHCYCCGHGNKKDCKSFEKGRGMSKKQFTFIKDTVAPNLKTPIVFSNETMSIGEVLDKLNGLSDENGQLRKENDMLSCELSVSVNKEISRNCRIAELEEENEQLKQENEKLQGEYDYLLWLYNGLGCEYDWLKEENEELKKKNKRSYYTYGHAGRILNEKFDRNV